MLSKKQRLSRKEFSLVYKNGRRLNANLFSLVYKKIDTAHIPRFSVVVSKKVSKSAVGRHLLKRRVYASVREFLKANPNFSYDSIFILHPLIKKDSFEEIKTSVSTTLSTLESSH